VPQHVQPWRPAHHRREHSTSISLCLSHRRLRRTHILGMLPLQHSSLRCRRNMDRERCRQAHHCNEALRKSHKRFAADDVVEVVHMYSWFQGQARGKELTDRLPGSCWLWAALDKRKVWNRWRRIVDPCQTDSVPLCRVSAMRNHLRGDMGCGESS
jgi:hypothetical protein